MRHHTGPADRQQARLRRRPNRPRRELRSPPPTLSSIVPMPRCRTLTGSNSSTDRCRTPTPTAALEVPAEDGSWRADVMGFVRRRSRRMAWEVQLSPITVEDIVTRTDRYTGERLRVRWVHPSARPPQRISAVPAVRVRAPQARGQPWVVDDGLAGSCTEAVGGNSRKIRSGGSSAGRWRNSSFPPRCSPPPVPEGVPNSRW